MQLQKGMVVRAIAGKEMDHFYVITDLDARFAFIADGKHRPLDRPKHKNVRHLRATSTVWDIGDMTDRALRRSLQEFSAKGGY